jgi:hypothetical protein
MSGKTLKFGKAAIIHKPGGYGVTWLHSDRPEEPLQ